MDEHQRKKLRAVARSVIRAGRYPPTTEHTRIMKCCLCNHDVYVRPVVIDAFRKVSRRPLAVCQVCTESPSFGASILEVIHQQEDK